MPRFDTKRIIFILSGIGLITLLSLFVQNYAHAAKEGKKYGNWVVTCEKGKNQKNCFLTQSLTSAAEDGKGAPQHFATFRIGYVNNSKDLQMIQVLPFGINLQSGSSIILSKDKLLAPGIFTTCQNFGCIAVAKISKKDLQAITKAKEAYVGVLSLDGRQINIKFDTKGLKEGVAALAGK